ncbi:hypothetical protein [Snodgrassella sp. CFCC 13594]|uniref:hypothetical protein n=1 Tax=Snodgrassella sp. CFCC 13594 TaxID=1775559 RepID=UPI00082CEE19|nr:hypothetical protein [Snodgrassella sp. CFCC 13594]
MANTHNELPPIPAKRYFTLDELCQLADISAEQFAAWQHAHGAVIGYGGNRYTRLDVIKVRQLRDSFAPYINGFTRNQTDADGNPAIDAEDARAQLQKLLRSLESALAK